MYLSWFLKFDDQGGGTGILLKPIEMHVRKTQDKERGLLDRASLNERIATHLLRAIESGRWKTILPGERELSVEYQVSRSTLRAALQLLKSEGVICSRHGSGNYIVQSQVKNPKTGGRKQVGLLIAKASDFLTSGHERLIWEMRERLDEMDCTLKLFSGARFLRPNPHFELERLVSSNPISCWILLASTKFIQQWFHERRLACMILGSPYGGIDLPTIDVNYEAVGRHAAGRLLSFGHRRIVMISGSRSNAGIRACENGFREVIQQKHSHYGEVTMEFLRHTHPVEQLEPKLDGLLTKRERPTALFVTSPGLYLYTFSYLAGLGLRVPSEVSLLCRDEDSVFDFIKPKPCCYRVESVQLVKCIIPMLNKIIHNRPLGEKTIQLIPDYQQGLSIGSR